MKALLILSFLLYCSNCYSDETKESSLYAIVDVETTGLNPNYHEMIDIGIIIINQNLEIQGQYFSKVLPSFPERIDPMAQNINGFDLQRWTQEEAISEVELINQMNIFLNNYIGKPIFIAFNSWFDSGFVRNLLNEHDYKFNDWFDYRVLDIPSIALACGYFPTTPDFNEKLATLLEVQPETKDPLKHTGESGVNFNYTVLRSLMNQGCFG
ncbi:MAG: exonuclease domain-containing protein [Gammaproteobacteria bacterium]|nr:exonuclease domain-containing protein [Gammaproteobacteria bacterium]